MMGFTHSLELGNEKEKLVLIYTPQDTFAQNLRPAKGAGLDADRNVRDPTFARSHVPTFARSHPS
jgi:hypothetical protein